jgi:toxin ParE1/3/4
MAYRLLISFEARQEAMAVFAYYEEQKAGLGDEFLAELEKYYAKLSSNPLAYSFMNNSKIIRDIYLNRFPYIIIFIVIEQQVNVLSVRHANRRSYL